MKNKKKPIRTCIVTKIQADKKDLVRIVRQKDGTVSVDLTGKLPGRGAYLLLRKEVVLKAIETKALEKVFKVPIPESIYERLLELAN